MQVNVSGCILSQSAKIKLILLFYDTEICTCSMYVHVCVCIFTVRVHQLPHVEVDSCGNGDVAQHLFFSFHF